MLVAEDGYERRVMSRLLHSRSVQKLGSSRYARWSVATRRTHPYRWFVVDVAEGLAVGALLWVFVSATVGVVFGAFVLLLSTSQLLLRLIQRRALGQRQ